MKIIINNILWIAHLLRVWIERKKNLVICTNFRDYSLAMLSLALRFIDTECIKQIHKIMVKVNGEPLQALRVGKRGMRHGFSKSYSRKLVSSPSSSRRSSFPNNECYFEVKLNICPWIREPRIKWKFLSFAASILRAFLRSVVLFSFYHKKKKKKNSQWITECKLNIQQTFLNCKI